MHDFFDKLGAAAKRAAGTVANEVSVAAEKQKLSDAYRDLGRRYYQALKRGEDADLAPEVAQIDDILRRLENLKDRRNMIDMDEDPLDTQATEEAQDAPAPVVTVEPYTDPTAEDPDFVIVEK